jgi:hypothetical protein
MLISDTIAKRAYAEHDRVYGRRPGNNPWSVSDHAALWLLGARAVADGDAASFHALHQTLSRYWRINRGKNQTVLPPAEIHDVLRKVPPKFRAMRLSELGDAHMPALYDTVVRASGIKRSESGPSVMAMSKYLHFLNPGLFVIVDREAVWSFVLKHAYLLEPVDAVRQRLRRILPQADATWVKDGCDLLSYLAILRWSGDIIRDNPRLTGIYLEYLSACCGGKPCPTDAVSFEAAAVEWMLLGLVEIPPYDLPGEQS